MTERMVVTPRRPDDPFDRRALREHVLVPEMLVALGDPEQEVRTAAAVALGLGLAGHREAAPLLRARLERGNPEFAPHAMVALALLNDRASIPLVSKLIGKKGSPKIVREGAIALALLRGRQAVPLLVNVDAVTELVAIL